MFRRGKTGEADIKKAIQKVQDNRKDNIIRLKNLKIVLGKNFCNIEIIKLL